MHRPLRLRCLRLWLGLVVATGCSSSEGPNITGSAGKGGNAGTTGVAGSTGSAGSTGAAGAAATTGTAGTNGGAGATGAAGTAGGAGAAGTGAVGGKGAAAGAGTGGANATAGHAGAAGGAGGGGGVGGGSGGAIALRLTSPAFTEGMSFPAQNTCAGANTSPELDWTPGPTGTMSYAVVLTDLTNNFVHWAIWNIPPTVHALPAMLATDATLSSPAGAMQVSLNGPSGYTGPCPSGALHMYQFQVHALSVATVAGISSTSMPPTASTDAKTSIVAKAIASASLTGTSNARRP